MRHEMLTQCACFCIGAMAKKGTLSQHFVMHVVGLEAWLWKRSGASSMTDDPLLSESARIPEIRYFFWLA